MTHKQWLAVWLASLPLLSAAGGCYVHQATLEGHDFMESGLANLKTGIAEYHADDLERMRIARRKLVSAFVADILSADGDEQKTRAVTEQFVALLERAEAAEEVEETRYRNMLDTLRAMGEVNASLRDLAQVKLGWRSELADYVNGLRGKMR